MKRILTLFSCLLLLASCSVSYKFNGAAVDYNFVKTMSIADFPNHADLVYPTLASTFTNELKDKFISQTQLNIIDNNADLELEGEIVGYETTELAIKEDARAATTRLTITVKVRYRNNKDPNDNLEQTFSGYQEYQNDQSLDAVQDELIRVIVNNLTDEIFNATLGNW